MDLWPLSSHKEKGARSSIHLVHPHSSSAVCISDLLKTIDRIGTSGALK